MSGSSIAIVALVVVAVVAVGVVSGLHQKAKAGNGVTISEANRARLSAPALSEAEFTEVVAEIVEASVPGAKVRIVEPLELAIVVEGGEIRRFLTNAWLTCKDDPDRRLSVVTDHVRSVSGSSKRLDAPSLPVESIIPMIKDETFVTSANALDPGSQVAAERLAADLWVVYAVDRPESISYLSETQRKTLALEMPELRTLAIANLRRILPPLQRQGEHTVFMLTAGGNFEASVLLLDDVWDEQEKAVSGEIVAAVPTRDVLVFTGSKSAAGLEAVHGSVRRLDGASYQVSKRLIVRQNKHWVAYDEPSH